MKLIVQLSGVDALSLKVSYLKKAAQAGLKLGVSEAAGYLVEEAKALAPIRTGRLRDAIHAEVLEDSRERQVQQVAPFVEAENEWGFTPAYARRIEYGFIGPDSLGRVFHQAPQPYMAPAFYNKRDDAAEAIKAGVYDQLDSAMATVAAKRVA